MLTDNLKKFIENNIELIEANRFDELYKKAEDGLYFSQGIGTLTRVLKSAKIDPLPYLKCIPYCFEYGNYNIKHFDIPDHIEYVSASSFSSCTALEQVTFGTNVSAIYYGVFEGCINLKNVELNEGLLTIGQYAFRGTDIEKIRLPSTLTKIDVQAFPDLVTFEVFPGTYAHEWVFIHFRSFACS